MKTIRLDLVDDYRIVVISDVHGHKKHLVGLLEEVGLQADDILIILGDFINRGKNSLETYEYIRKLSERENTYILKGNHEYFIHTFIKDEEKIGRLHDFLKEGFYETIIESALNHTDHDIHTISTEELLTYFEDHDSMTYLESLPVYLEADGHIFVHGGYDESFVDEGKFLKYDNYNELSGVHELKVVVGHWPTSNLRYHELSNRPFYNDEKNIIFIDGGLGVKATGELNALIITKKNGRVIYSCEQYNEFEPATITGSHQFLHEPMIHVDYPHYQFDFIEEGDVFSLCRHRHSGMTFHVFNGLIEKTNSGYELKTGYINNFLDLEIGDEVHVCELYEDCALVKYKGTFGWIKRSQLEL